MAIYTNYARYLKAKKFKDMISGTGDNAGDTYMLLGMGNPFWDYIPEDAEDGDTAAKMPVAPYNTSIVTVGDANSNQFYDALCQQCFISGNEHTSVIEDGVPKDDTYAEAVKDVLPPFPCNWHEKIESGDEGTCIYVSTHNPEEKIFLNDFQNYYIDNDGYVFDTETSSRWDFAEALPTGSSAEDVIYRQAYADMYLRGQAIKGGIIHPVGLLGAVKCNVSFVKDIGTNENVYQGKINQIWYGDRFWEILDEDPVAKALQDNTTLPKDEDIPHHILFNATINPMMLCPELRIDQNIVPRQIAICVRKKPIPSGTENLSPDYFPVNDTNVFNFGQYTQAYINDPSNLLGKTILNFTLPVKVGEDNIYPGSDDTDFKILFVDYIRGSVRDNHSIDRIGYVLGF